MSEIASKDLGLQAWLKISAFSEEGDGIYTSEFGITADGRWYWGDEGIGSDTDGVDLAAEITLWSHDLNDSCSEWVHHGAFNKTVRADLFSSDALVSCLDNFLGSGEIEADYLGLSSLDSWDSPEMQEHITQGFGASLTWRFTWTQAEFQKQARDACLFPTIN